MRSEKLPGAIDTVKPTFGWLDEQALVAESNERAGG
jgi:hypothetical protein